jgi:hypothetical protein
MTAVESIDRASARRARTWPSPAVVFGLGTAAWAVGIVRSDVSHMSDYGLVATASPVCLAGTTAIVASFLLELSTPRPRSRLLVLQLVATVIALMGLASILEPEARLPTAWLHAGFTKQLLDHGEVLHSYDARFNWAGGFAFAAMLARASGLPDVIAFLRWTPLVLNLLYLVPVASIVRSLLPPGRRRGVALVLFVCCNWVEQDYFSPQGVSYLLYLSVLAWALYRHRSPETWTTRLAEVGLVTAVFAALVVTHQLTPYALLLELLVLVCFRRLSWTQAPLVLAVLAIGWLNLGAQEFWASHLHVLTGDVSNVGSSVDQSLVARTGGSGAHIVSIGSRLGITAGLAIAAAIGAVRLRRTGWPIVALALAPFGLIAAQSYGGEILLRSYFFALPFASILAAVGLVDVSRLVNRLGGRAAVVLVVWCVSGAATVGLVSARYGNEPYVAASRADVAAVEWVDAHAAPRSTIAVLTQYLPWRADDLVTFRYRSLAAMCGDSLDLECVRKASPDYLIVTDGQRRYLELVVQRPASEMESLENDVVADLGYRLAYAAGTARVYER